MIWLFLSHFFFDFICQSRDMGKKKSENFVYLFAHTFIIFIGVGIGAYYVFDKSFEKALMFGFYNAVTHCVIDGLIWRFYKIFKIIGLVGPDGFMEYLVDKKNTQKIEEFKSNFKYWEDPWFYSTIGFDQFLHFSTIYLIYEHMTRTL